MMDKEYTSQGLSKRLHDRGFRGEHEILWYQYHKNVPYHTVEIVNCPFASGYPAYTFTELWGVLPQFLKVGIHETDAATWSLTHDKLSNKGNRIGYRWYDAPFYLDDKAYHHESPAEAAGLLLEWLIDEGHVGDLIKGGE